jgi:hypothetical protein
MYTVLQAITSEEATVQIGCVAEPIPHLLPRIATGKGLEKERY